MSTKVDHHVGFAPEHLRCGLLAVLSEQRRAEKCFEGHDRWWSVGDVGSERESVGGAAPQEHSDETVDYLLGGGRENVLIIHYLFARAAMARTRADDLGRPRQLRWCSSGGIWLE